MAKVAAKLADKHKYRLLGAADRQHKALGSDLPAIFSILSAAGQPLRPFEIALALEAKNKPAGDWHAISRRCWRLVELGDATAIELTRGYAFEAVTR